MDALITLNCWIRSEDPEDSLFRVEISKTATIFGLQEAIKDKKSATFRDVDTDALALHKPKTAISIPYEEHLSKLILSRDGEPLRKLNKLSKFFPEPPPEDDIHVIVDAPSLIVCWLRGADPNDCLPISIHPGEGIDKLIPRIRDAHQQLKDVANNLIRIFKISGDESELREFLNKTGGGELLQGSRLAPNFLDVPVLDPLRLVIDTVGNHSPTLFGQEPISHSNDELEEYRDIFLEVNNWSGFEESDIQRNHIVEARLPFPPFVTTFEQKLLQTPRLPNNVGVQTPSGNPEQYFEPYQTSTAEDPQEEMHNANPSEVIHIASLVVLDWEKYWQLNGPCKRPLKENAMDMIFFGPFLLQEKRAAATILRNQPCPLTVVLKRVGESERRQYSPRSDFLISRSNLHRLLVEVNSTPESSWPKDLVRMLTTGAFIVRFANNFVSTFNQGKNFVLCAFFIWDNGNVTRFTLFQQQIPNDKKVYYKIWPFSFNSPSDRVMFARHLYNLLSITLDQGQDGVVGDAIDKLNKTVEGCHMRSMHTKTTTRRGSRKRARAESNHDGSASGEGGNGHIAQLRARGYEVEPKVIVDDRGGTLKPLYKTPDHILNVYRPTNRNKVLIAKKVREESDELEILKFLDTMPPKSDHVISLVDSFGEWAIFPKMTTVGYYVDFSRKELQSKVPRVCLGLIEGLAHLHRLCIAHRDIKPENLVVDKNFTLQIIDFDVAMRVKEENEEVDDPCGTERWMAPEVKKKLRHSPIKADRWSCGLVLVFLLGVSGKEDISLKVFARNLVAHDPKQRPSLLEWDRCLVPFSDSDTSKASQLRRDRVEGDEEMTKLNVKKQRLDSGLGGLRGRYGLGLMVEAPVELVK